MIVHGITHDAPRPNTQVVNVFRFNANALILAMLAASDTWLLITKLKSSLAFESGLLKNDDDDRAAAQPSPPSNSIL